MPTRFRRSIKIAPGVKLNVGKKSGSISFGKRGASMNFGSRGIYGNIGIPGTGLSYRSKIGDSSHNTQQKALQNAGSSNSGQSEITVLISLLDDGSIVIKDEKGNLLPDEWIRKAKSQNKDFILGWLQQHCDEKNEEITSLINIHLSTPPPDTEISFIPSKFAKEKPEPPEKEFLVPKPISPEKKEYGFMASKVRFIREKIDKRNVELQNKFDEQLYKWELEKEKFETNYKKFFSEHLKQLDEYDHQKKNFEIEQDKRRKFIEEDRFTDIDAMKQFLEEVLQTIVWPKETLVSFEVNNEGTEVLMDVHLPEFEEMPEIRTNVNKRDLKLSLSPISETQKRKNYYTHIHAIGFRLIGEVFVSLPSVNTIIFSGYSHRISKSTGKLSTEYLYSVKVHREKWENINFQNLDMIDVVLCFEEFDLRREATKTGLIKTITPFTN